MKTVSLHGHRIAYRRDGRPEDPALLLVHGIAGTSRTWNPVVPALARDHDVLAPDLPGHGGSDPPIGDYSTGAYACALRDLVEVLEIDRVTIVGHSLGGGVAMQFAYQFPELVERLVLVNSGGLGREVNLVIRAAGLPGSELVVPLLASAPARGAGRLLAAALGAVGIRPDTDAREAAASLASLSHGPTRRAFLGTVRTLVNARGQQVQASDRLYLTEDVPTMVVWGEKDSIIPISHGHEAVDAMPKARMEVFDGAGHFPHIDEPERFADLLAAFVREQPPATYDRARLRQRLMG